MPKIFLLSMLSILSVMIVSLMVTGCGINKAELTLLNVSYDPTRELYKEYNYEFIEYWFKETGQYINILQSHGGTGSQARAVIDGLSADVVTLALAYDIDMLHEKADLVPANWQQRLQYNSSPYTSTIVFLVRKDNPKNIYNWSDLIKNDVEVVAANPKTSGGARWNYLAAWGYAMKKYDDELMALEFVKRLYNNVTVLDTGARASTTTFVERGLGDVLITWENEALLAINEFGSDKYQMIAPPISILAEPPVTVIDKNVDEKGTRKLAEAYLAYMYTDYAQHLIARHNYRPQNKLILEQYRHVFEEIEMFTIEEMFGDWKSLHNKHFSDGGIFDSIYLEANKNGSN